MFPTSIIDLISKTSPVLGSALGGPIGGVVGDLISSVLGGVNMTDHESVAKSLEGQQNQQKLRDLEMQLTDLQNARLAAEKDTGVLRYQRIFLALLAMAALVGDIYAIQYVTDKMLNEILIMMLVFLVWDIRQIYKFYFGSSEDLPNPFMKKKS
jgi:hypothetical protein